MTDIPEVVLNNGLKMPQFGLGVWRIPEEDTAANVVAAVRAGYRLIDTATIYRNEAGVGKGVRESGVPRAELFVTSKLWNSDHGYNEALVGFDASLERLGLDYLDLYMIHWPLPKYDKYVETWRALEKLYKDGRVKAIGVSNFQIAHLERLSQECEVIPAVNQIELHPRFTQANLRKYGSEHGIQIESWSPLRGVLSEETPAAIQELADRHGKSPAQVILRWHIQLGLVVIARSSKPERLRENRDIFDFVLSEADMAVISALDTADGRIGANPDEMDRRV